MKGSENQSVECQPDDAFRLNCKLMSHIADATDERLFVWTDKRMVGRAYGYLDKLESITLVEERGIVALAHGEKDYYTNVFIGDDGELESICSCPVGHRCKHAVAVIIKVSRFIKAGGRISIVAHDSEFWKAAESAFSAAKARLEERNRKKLEERLAHEREEAEIRAAMEKRHNEALALYTGFLKRIKDSYSRGEYDVVLKILDEACKSTDEDLYTESYGGELSDLFDEISRLALESLKCCNMSAAEKILFAHDAETPYRYYISPCFLYDEYWGGKNKANFSPAVWLEVAKSLKARLDNRAFVEECGFHALCHIVSDACEAYWSADRGEEAFELRKRFAAETDDWSICADDLCRLGRCEDAKSLLLEARDFVRSPENDDWDDGHLFIDKLADVYASEGNFAYAAALMAENWLAIVGSIDHCDNQYGLERILDMAEKAGFRREVFAALAHAVDTRVPPHGVASKDEPLWCPGKKILPPPFIDRLPPRWPLPPSGLDLGVPNPLFQIEAHWWSAETVLIRVAINEGLFDEAAHRYLKLSNNPGHTFDASKEDGLTEFERIVQKALAEKYSDVAQKIAQISNHRKMVWSNYRNYR